VVTSSPSWYPGWGAEDWSGTFVDEGVARHRAASLQSGSKHVFVIEITLGNAATSFRVIHEDHGDTLVMPEHEAVRA